MVKRILWILLDVAVAALILLGVWVINFKIPQKGVRGVNMRRRTRPEMIPEVPVCRIPVGLEAVQIQETG